MHETEGNGYEWWRSEVKADGKGSNNFKLSLSATVLVLKLSAHKFCHIYRLYFIDFIPLFNVPRGLTIYTTN